MLINKKNTHNFFPQVGHTANLDPIRCWPNVANSTQKQTDRREKTNQTPAEEETGARAGDDRKIHPTCRMRA